MQRKYLYLCLMIAMLLALGVACSSKDSGQTAPQTTTKTSSEPTTVTEAVEDNNENLDTEIADVEEDVEEEIAEVTPYPLRPAKDLGGKTLIVDAWWLDFDWNAERPEDEPGTKSYATLLKEAEERYNAKIEFTVSGWGENLDKLTTSVLAGDPYCDLIRLENFQAMPNAVSKGLLMPLDDLTDYIDLDTELSDVMKILGSFAGRRNAYKIKRGEERGKAGYIRQIKQKIR